MYVLKKNLPLFTFSLFSPKGQIDERGMDMIGEYGLDLRIYRVDQDGRTFFFFIFYFFCI